MEKEEVQDDGKASMLHWYLQMAGRTAGADASPDKLTSFTTDLQHGHSIPPLSRLHATATGMRTAPTQHTHLSDRPYLLPA